MLHHRSHLTRSSGFTSGYSHFGKRTLSTHKSVRAGDHLFRTDLALVAPVDTTVVNRRNGYYRSTYDTSLSIIDDWSIGGMLGHYACVRPV